MRDRKAIEAFLVLCSQALTCPLYFSLFININMLTDTFYDAQTLHMYEKDLSKPRRPFFPSTELIIFKVLAYIYFFFFNKIFLFVRRSKMPLKQPVSTAEGSALRWCWFRMCYMVGCERFYNCTTSTLMAEVKLPLISTYILVKAHSGSQFFHFSSCLLHRLYT